MHRPPSASATVAHADTAETNQGRPLIRTHGEVHGPLAVLSASLLEQLCTTGYERCDDGSEPRLVLNHITPEEPSPFRRRAQATFVLSLMELPEVPEGGTMTLYPYLVRSLSNMLLVSVPDEAIHFLTLETGHFVEPVGAGLIGRLVARIEPVASSVLVVDNVFVPDLEPELWQGHEHTLALAAAGRRLAE